MASETVSKVFDTLKKNLNVGKPCGEDESKLKFSQLPYPGDSGFVQWHEAMKMVCRLPGGIPAEFRKTLWLTLSEQHLLRAEIEWSKVERICFNDKSNPDDEELGAQIVKDLHRTGCSSFCAGAEAEFNQALLKRVLLAYARWNKKVGYCQGFNMLAALLLEVMDHNQVHALKAMIYLVEGVLPEDYFSHSLRGLSVDMAAFRDLLRLRLPDLSKHLDQLQRDAREGTSGSSYEPPLVNVFTMQWFLTLFSTCLPQPTVLRVWDLVFLEGSEILLRTALVLWEALEDRISHVESADKFYSIMAVLTREMLQFGLMDTNQLIERIVVMAPFPLPGLSELRDKYTYNIAPWMELQGAKKPINFRKVLKADDEDDDEESRIALAAVFSSMFPILRSKESGVEKGPESLAATGMSTPGSFSRNPETILKRRMSAGLETVRACGDRANLDISALKNQYAKLRERQRQAHIILTGAAAKAPGLPLSAQSSVAMNHLLLGKKALSRHAHKMAKKAAAPLKSRPEFSFIKSSRVHAEKVRGQDSSKDGFRTTQPGCSPKTRQAGIDDRSDSSSSTELCDNVGDTDDEVDEITEETCRLDVEGIREEGSLEDDGGWGGEQTLSRAGDPGLGKENASMSFVRRQRSFDAQKVIEENLEILQKMTIDKSPKQRNNSESDVIDSASYDVVFDTTGCPEMVLTDSTKNGDVEADAGCPERQHPIGDASFANHPKAKQQKKAKPFSNTTPVFIEPTKPIVNPFPSRARPRKTHNEVAVKLGLYSPSER